MTILAPDTFAMALTGLMRLGHEGRQAFLTARANQADLKSLAPSPQFFAENVPPDQSELMIARWACEMVWDGGECDPGAQFEGLFRIDSASQRPARLQSGWPAIAEGRERDFERAVAWSLAQHHRARAREMSNGIVLWHQRQWLEQNPTSPWARFARHMLDVSLDFVATQPGFLGGGRKAKTLFAALAPNLASSYSADEHNGGLAPSRLAEAFAEAALETMVERPDLIDDDARWGPLITGVLEPLQAEVAENGARFLLAEGKLRELFSGPMAHAALSAIAGNADEFLTGNAGSEDILGVILRGTLGELVSTDPSAFRLRQVFSADGARTVVVSALQSASQRPDLFKVSGEHGAKLLSGFADVLIDAPRPFGAGDGMAPDVVSMALGVLADYADTRILGAASGHADSQMGAAVASHLVRDLLDGFSRVAISKNENLFADVFTRSQAMDVLKLMAEHVARSPGAFIGGSDSPVVRAMAETVASAIAEDKDGLLTGGDWQGVIALALDAALDNPGTLFSLNPADGPADSVALILIRQMLGHARTNMARPANANGRVMFGRTLREAITVTLSAASTGILNTFMSRADMLDHLAAVDALVERLNGLAASPDRALVIGSREWLDIYTYYIAHALETGRAGIDTLSDAQLLAVLRGTGLQPSNGDHLG